MPDYKDYKNIIAFFDEYIAHFKVFLNFEYMKMDMINHDQIEKLSDSLSSEQALIMKTNSLEGRRMKLLENVNAATFAELIEKSPPQFGKRFKEQHEELAELVFKIKELNDTANIIVTERLKKIQRRTAELDVYDGKGAVKREHATKSAIFRNV